MTVGGYGATPGGAGGIPFDGSQQTQGPAQVQQAPPTPGSYDATLSTIAQSIAEALKKPLNASMPLLIPPGMNATQFYQMMSQSGGNPVSGDAIKLAVARDIVDTYNQAINDVLDKWNESIKEQARIAEEKALREATIEVPQNTARGGAGYEAWLNALPPQTKDQVVAINKNADVQSWVVDGISSYINGTEPTSTAAAAANAQSSSSLSNPLASEGVMAAIITGSLVLDANLTTAPLGLADPVTSKQIASNPYQDAFMSVSPSAGLAADYTAAAAMIAALMGRAVSTVSPFNQTEKADPANPTPQNLQFAQDYAESMVALVSGPGFNNFMMAIVTQKMDNAPALNESQQKDLVNATKTVLLTTALVFLYKACTGAGDPNLGGMSGDEFLALLKPGADMKELFPDLNESLQGTFQKLVDAIRASLPQDPTMAGNMLNALADYIDTNPKNDDLLAVDKVFSGLNDQLPPPSAVRA